MIKLIIKRLGIMTQSVTSHAGLSVPVFLLVFTFFSCTGTVNTAQQIRADSAENRIQDLSGVYKITGAENCNLAITIKKINQGYVYIIDVSGDLSSGNLSIENEENRIYLKFNGTIRSGDNTTVEGAYSDGKINIQNYGNAINQYRCFKKCDAKYLELVKVPQ